MRRLIFRALRRFHRDEGGMTLIELLVASSIGLVVIGGGVLIFTSVVHSEPRTSSRAAAIADGRVMMERITRELRQGGVVTTAGANQLSLVTWVDSASCGGSYSQTAIQCQVTYTCAGGACTRIEAAAGSQTGTSVIVASGLDGSNVFSYSSCSGSPSITEYVGVRLVFVAEDAEDAITLSDGVSLRNNASCQT